MPIKKPILKKPTKQIVGTFYSSVEIQKQTDKKRKRRDQGDEMIKGYWIPAYKRKTKSKKS